VNSELIGPRDLGQLQFYIQTIDNQVAT